MSRRLAPAPPTAPHHALTAKLCEELRENPLGHPPDDRFLEPIGRHVSGLAADFEARGVVRLGMQQVVEVNPAGRGYFGVGSERRAVGKDEDERPDRDRRQHGRAGYDVVETAEEIATAQ